MPEMQAADGISPPSSSAPVVNTIVVWVLGVIGLLTIIQWTAITVGNTSGLHRILCFRQRSKVSTPPTPSRE